MTLRELLIDTAGSFIIESYQRPYIWGRPHRTRPDSVSLLLDALLDAFAHSTDYLIHAVTLIRRDDGVEVVDGQQRLVFLLLLMRSLNSEIPFTISYPHRPDSEHFLRCLSPDSIAATVRDDLDPRRGIDIYHFSLTLKIIADRLQHADINRCEFAEYVLDKLQLTPIALSESREAVTVFKMLAGAKSQIEPADIIKAALLRLRALGTTAPDTLLPDAEEWDAMVNLWTRPDVREYFMLNDEPGVNLPIRLAMCGDDESPSDVPLSYHEFVRRYPDDSSRFALYRRIRTIHRRIMDALAAPAVYNRIRAILLLQDPGGRDLFLKRYFRDCTVDDEALDRFYKYSFLDMSATDIDAGKSPAEPFSELLATLSMADVYHTEARRDAYNLLLRLNIDEDIKLGRKFDFSIWNNRSLEHIFSKSKVWHIGADGSPLDGNDTPLHTSIANLRRDASFLNREQITNADGALLSEHCIGNLVLLYGLNNAAFGNANFEAKKQMFLAPGDLTVFRSRNLLHSVCVFAEARWGAKEIVDNYNRTLKNLKIYYGFK